MKNLTEANNTLCFEGLPLAQIAAQFGTPCYVYGEASIKAQYRAIDAVFTVPHKIAYAVKANGSLAILNTLAQLSAEFDIVSGGELARVLKAGGSPENIFFSGVGKSAAEIRFALTSGIACLNIESMEELERVHHIASQLDIIAPIAFRINPHINVITHRYIATGLKGHKFGIPYKDAPALLQTLSSMPHVSLTGLACHLGSQLTDIGAYESSAQTLFQLADAYYAQGGKPLRFLSLGGGMSIAYHNESPMDIALLGQKISALFEKRQETLVVEPGRFIIAPSGLLLTRIEYLKQTDDKHFAIVDAGMNDLIRPALYEAWHTICPVDQKNIPAQTMDVVGPVCESGDFFGHDRSLAVEAGDLLAVLNAGAYCMSMSSQYNARPRACEVLIRNGKPVLIRERETYEDLWQHEHI